MAESHPTYDARLDKSIEQNSIWREKTAEEFRKKYGAWWIFCNVDVRKKKTWIEQYRKPEVKNASKK
tara:strand:+ start:550 stop:750 length:201 start_codon:yes stop_codon:yes gene_type:complete